MSSELDKSLSPEGKTGAINILDKFVVCVNDEKYSDLKIIVKEGAVIFAHTIFLFTQNNVFRANINDAIAKSENAGKITLWIEDFDADVVIRMLKFIYAKQLIESEVDIHLLKLASRYELLELKDKCQHILISLLSSENAAETLYYANECEAQKLKRKTMDFIHRNSIAVVNSKAWKQLKTRPNSAKVFANLYENKAAGKLVCDYESASDKSLSPEGRAGTRHESDKYAGYVNNFQFSDVTIDSGDGFQIFAHKVILCAQIDYFECMFSKKFENFNGGVDNRIEMKDFKRNVIISMLTFIYTGKIQKSEIDFELLGIAQKYQIKELKDKCQLYLISKLSLGNAVESLIWADHHGASDLKNAATDIILTNPAVLESDAWKEMEKRPHLHHIINNLFKDLVKQIKKDGYSPPKKYARK